MRIASSLLQTLAHENQRPDKSASTKWPLRHDSDDGSPQIHYCQCLPPPLWQLGHGSSVRNALLHAGIANICRISAPCVRVELS